MEKQRICSKFRLFKRLLILTSLVTLHFSLFASMTIPSEELKKLVIVPDENQSFVTDKDIKYSVIIPGINPADVEVSTPELQDNTQFKTLRRTRYNDNDTKLELWYEFPEKGAYTPAPLKVNIEGKEYLLYFAAIRIEENNLTSKPSMVIVFKNGKILSEKTAAPLFTSPSGKEIYFSVYVRNAREIVSADYTLPRDGLLEKLQRTEPAQKLTENLLYWADFKWTPLTKGKAAVPYMEIKVTGNNSLKTVLETPEAYINITKGSSVSSTGKSDSLFKDAFTFIQPKEEEAPEVVTGENQIAAKAAARKHRCLLWLFIILFILIIAAVILLVLKVKSPIPYLILSVLALFTIFTFSALSKKKTAVYTSGIIKSIPEEKGGTIIRMAEYSEVRILKETNDWYCIQSSSVTGWTTKENVRFY